MHGVSWRRVKWPRPSWVRKDFLSVCGIVLGSIAASRYYLLACCGASWKPLRRLWGTSWASGSLRGFWPALGRPWARPGRPPGPLLAAPGLLLGLSWAALGRSWRLLELSGRLQSRFLPKSRNPSTYSVFHSFLGVREASWHLLGPFWCPLGGPWGPPGKSWAGQRGLGWLLGGSWQA